MSIYNIPPLLSLMGFVGLGILTVKRGKWAASDVLFLIICLLGTMLYGDALSAFFVKNPGTRLFIRRSGYLFLVYLFPVYLHFFYAYLEINKDKWVLWLAYAFAFVLMWFTQSPLFIQSLKHHYFGYFPLGGPLYPLFGISSLAVMVYVVVLTARTIQRTKSATRKNQLKYLLAGFGLLGLLNIFSFLPIWGMSFYPLGNLSFIALIIFGFGLFKHDLMDWGVFIRKGLVASIITSVLTCVYALIIIAADNLLSGYDFSSSIYFPVLFFLFVAIIFGPINSAVKKTVDRLFYQGRYDYQKTLKDFSQMIISVLDIHEVIERITTALKQSIQIDNAMLFLSKPSGSGYKNYEQTGSNPGASPIFIENDSAIVNALKTQRKLIFKSSLMASKKPENRDVVHEMTQLNGELVIPLMLHDRLNGFLLLGEKKSGEVFSGEDIDLFETLSAQGALAVENARAYGEIEALNRDLEKKVEVRTHELKKALLEKERTQEQLIQSESLAAIGQLVAGTAHELNNPLASVSSILQSSIEDLKETQDNPRVDEDFIQDMAFAQKELRRASDIVKSLLDLSRQTQTFSELVNMNAVIRDALQILHNQHKREDLDIIEDYEEDLPDILGNFSNLGQVMLNIIQNAIQAVENNGGQINLRTKYEKTSDCVVVECADSGPGIPETLRQDIFKPFFTTKSVGKGTGLGLYICHEIIQKHCGSISLTDNNGQGTKFVINLPLKTLDPIPEGQL